MSTCSETIEYPPAVKSKTARGKYKQQVLRERPETLFLNMYKDGRACNLIFCTDEAYVWLDVISSYYSSVKTIICNGWRISVLEENDPDNTIMSVNLFKNGTAMVQGHLAKFEDDFPTMKLRAQKEKEGLINTPPTHGSKTSTSSLPTPDREPADADTDPPLLGHPEALNIMREQFSQMEMELVQLSELSNSPSFQNTLTIFRREQEDVLNTWLRVFQQDRASHSRQLVYLSEEVKQLRSDRDSCEAEIAALREELLERDRTLLSLQESLKTQWSLPTVTPQNQPCICSAST